MLRRLLISLCAVVAINSVVAQKPWAEYDAAEQRRLLNSRRTSSAVRRAYENIADMDYATRCEAWSVVSVPVRNSRLASLYLHLYEVLRPKDGSAAEQDMAMLAAYPDYMLSLWEREAHRYDIYNYAYALGRYDALHEVRSTAALRPMFKRKMFKRYATTAVRLRSAVAVARESEAAGAIAAIDLTAPMRLEAEPSYISKASFAEAVNAIKPLSVGLSVVDELHEAMVAECLMFGGSYNVDIEHAMGRDIAVTYCSANGGDYLLLSDKAGMDYTLPSMLYCLPSGHIFAIGDGKMFDCQVIVGRVVDGVIAIDGMLPLAGEAHEVRCNERGLYLHVALSDDYLFVAAE